MHVSESLGQLEKLSAELCVEQGFSSNLLCSNCARLPEFGLEQLTDVCQKCCLEDADTEKKTYAKAQLEICGWKIGKYPQIQAFLKSDKPNQFTNLKVKYVKGADPVLKFFDAQNNIEEVMSIEKWNTDTVEEFLQQHLAL